jgi:hypothetical protein
VSHFRGAGSSYKQLWEEIDFQAAGTPGGLNFGWAIREGPCARGRQQPCVAASPELTEPIAFYDRGTGASVTGGFVYRGSRFPALSGRYFYGDFISGRIWSLPPAGGTSERVPRLELETGLGISSFGEDESGELYVVDYFGGEIRGLEDAVNAPVILAATIHGFVGVPYFRRISVAGGRPPFRFELVGRNACPGAIGTEGFGRHGERHADFSGYIRALHGSGHGFSRYFQRKGADPPHPFAIRSVEVVGDYSETVLLTQTSRTIAHSCSTSSRSGRFSSRPK